VSTDTQPLAQWEVELLDATFNPGYTWRLL
jgi:hypothetical protein